MDNQIKNKILKKIKDFEEIPVFSNEIQKLVEITDISETELIKKLKFEIPITTNILRLANSHLYKIKKKLVRSMNWYQY